MIQRLGFEISYLFKNTPWDTGISPGELANYLDTHPPGRALDLGCGTGTNAITIANRGWKTVGIDFSSIAIGRARRKARAASLEITFYQGDATKVDLIDGDFDLVLDIGCFHGLSIDRRKVYEVNLRRLLRPGGTFLLYTWLKMDEAEQSWLPTEQQIRNLFDHTLSTLQVEHGLDKNGERSSAWFTLRKQAG